MSRQRRVHVYVLTCKDERLCASLALELDISAVQTFDELQRSVAAFYGIVQADGVAFQAGESELSELSEITSSEVPVGITVGGHSVREVPGPQGLPWVGNYFEGEW